MSAMSHAKVVIADFKDLITDDELTRVYTRYNDSSHTECRHSG